jgi:hypothetical protein
MRIGLRMRSMPRLPHRKTDRLFLVGYIALCFWRASKKIDFPYLDECSPTAEFGSGPGVYGCFDSGGLGIPLGVSPFDWVLGSAMSVKG